MHWAATKAGREPKKMPSPEDLIASIKDHELRISIAITSITHILENLKEGTKHYTQLNDHLTNLLRTKEAVLGVVPSKENDEGEPVPPDVVAMRGRLIAKARRRRWSSGGNR